MVGKDGATTPTADSQRACAFHIVSSESITFAPHNISHGERAGGRGGSYCPTRGREERLTLGGAVSCGSVTQWQRRADQNVLAPPAILVLQGLGRAGSSLSRQGQDLGPDLHLAMWAAQPCHAHFPHPGRGNSAFHTGPTPSLPAAGPAFVHSLCVTAGREPVGGRDARPLPRELSNDVKSTQKALAVHRVWKK